MGQVINIFFINVSIIYLVLSLALYLMRQLLPIQTGSPYAVRIGFGLAMGLASVLLTVNSFPVGEARIDLRIIPLAGAEPGTVVFERADAALYQAKTSGRDQAKIG